MTFPEILCVSTIVKNINPGPPESDIRNPPVPAANSASVPANNARFVPDVRFSNISFNTVCVFVSTAIPVTRYFPLLPTVPVKVNIFAPSVRPSLPARIVFEQRLPFHRRLARHKISPPPQHPPLLPILFPLRPLALHIRIKPQTLRRSERPDRQQIPHIQPAHISRQHINILRRQLHLPLARHAINRLHLISQPAQPPRRFHLRPPHPSPPSRPNNKIKALAVTPRLGNPQPQPRRPQQKRRLRNLSQPLRIPLPPLIPSLLRLLRHRKNPGNNLRKILSRTIRSRRILYGRISSCGAGALTRDSLLLTLPFATHRPIPPTPIVIPRPSRKRRARNLLTSLPAPSILTNFALPLKVKCHTPRLWITF